jgi:hypothetical protein
MPELLDRLDNLYRLRETLEDEKRFYLNRKEWPKVTVRKQNLKVLSDRIAGLEYKIRMTNRAALAA